MRQMASSLPAIEPKGDEVVEDTPVLPTPPADAPNEKSGEQLSDEEQNEHHHHHHPHIHLPHHLRGKRMMSFIHPHTGRHVHVAHTPDELGSQSL